jgi:proteasome assembly chaperone (PAC2) family protein
MNIQGIDTEYIPVLDSSILIVGLTGWGNALNVSRGMASFLVRALQAEPFARLRPDPFYRYDEHRPEIEVTAGELKRLTPPGGAFYLPAIDLEGRIPVILSADEPDLNWHRFTDDIFALCETMGVTSVVSLGSMFDNVLHTDRTISAIASDEAVFERLRRRSVYPISYKGPSAIHGLIHAQAVKQGLDSVSLWAHCPYYLQGITHFGLLAGMASLLADLWRIDLDPGELEASWDRMNTQIQEMIDKNPEIQELIRKLRKEKVRGSWANMKSSAQDGEKVIHLKDFLDPR